MKEFDFYKAWRELANPEFYLQPQNVRDLFWDTRVLSQNLSQKSNLDMPWPDEDDYIGNEHLLFDETINLKLRFERLDSDILAKAARVIYFWGHWGPSICNGMGAYWKFANYVDQILRERCDVSKHSRGRVLFEIDEGFIRVCFSSKDEWTWEEVCLATPNNIEKCRKALSDYHINNWNEHRGFVKDLRELFDDDFSKRWLEKDKFMVERSEMSETWYPDGWFRPNTPEGLMKLADRYVDTDLLKDLIFEMKKKEAEKINSSLESQINYLSRYNRFGMRGTIDLIWKYRK